MKKIIALLLSFACLFAFFGCEEPLPPEDHIKPDMVFKFEELTITLTEAFKVTEQEKNSIWYESESNVISVSIDANEIPVVKEVPINFETYVTSFFEVSPYTPKEEIKCEDGVYFAECEVRILGSNSLYFISFYESETTYYVAYFMCELADYEEYKPYIVKWAESVVVTPKEAEQTEETE